MILVSDLHFQHPNSRSIKKSSVLLIKTESNCVEAIKHLCKIYAGTQLLLRYLNQGQILGCLPHKYSCNHMN